MTTDTGKRIIFVGSYMDLFNALQAAREQDAVIDAINERAADDRPAVDEAPWTVGDRASLAYGDHSLDADIELFERRRNEILAIMKEEPLTKEQANAYIEELAEIQTRLD